jgi:hypothetical protein
MKIKDAGLRIRIDRSLRDEFVEACRAQDKSAAQVLRDFMRLYVEKQSRSGSSPRQIKKLKSSQ